MKAELFEKLDGLLTWEVASLQTSISEEISVKILKAQLHSQIRTASGRTQVFYFQLFCTDMKRRHYTLMIDFFSDPETSSCFSSLFLF